MIGKILSQKEKGFITDLFSVQIMGEIMRIFLPYPE